MIFFDCLDSRILVKVSSSSIIPYLFYTESTSNMLTPQKNSLAPKKQRPEAELWEMTEAVADALQRAELRLMERAELGVASESSMGALGSMAAFMAEVGIGFRMGCGEFCGAPCFFFSRGEVLVQNVFCCVCFRGCPTEMHQMGDISIFD